MTRMPKAAQSRATRVPMRPKPRTSTCRPPSSKVLDWPRTRHSPRRTAAETGPTLRARFSISISACSATEAALASGVIISAMPRSRQRRHVDQVVAHAMPADDAQPLRLGQQRLVDRRAAHDQAVGVAQPVDQRLAVRGAGMVERDAGCRRQAFDAVRMNRIGDDDMGHEG